MFFEKISSCPYFSFFCSPSCTNFRTRNHISRNSRSQAFASAKFRKINKKTYNAVESFFSKVAAEAFMRDFFLVKLFEDFQNNFFLRHTLWNVLFSVGCIYLVTWYAFVLTCKHFNLCCAFFIICCALFHCVLFSLCSAYFPLCTHFIRWTYAFHYVKHLLRGAQLTVNEKTSELNVNICFQLKFIGIHILKIRSEEGI